LILVELSLRKQNMEDAGDSLFGEHAQKVGVSNHFPQDKRRPVMF
jgi:hypothetical protein